MNFDELILLAQSFGALTGFSTLIPALINLLKANHIIHDGDSLKWTGFFQTLLLAAFILMGHFNINIQAVDQNIKYLLDFGGAFILLMTELGLDQIWYDIWKKLNLGSLSFSFPK